MVVIVILLDNFFLLLLLLELVLILVFDLPLVVLLFHFLLIVIEVVNQIFVLRVCLLLILSLELGRGGFFLLVLVILGHLPEGLVLDFLEDAEDGEDEVEEEKEEEGGLEQEGVEVVGVVHLDGGWQLGSVGNALGGGSKEP